MFGHGSCALALLLAARSPGYSRGLLFPRAPSSIQSRLVVGLEADPQHPKHGKPVQGDCLVQPSIRLLAGQEFRSTRRTCSVMSTALERSLVIDALRSTLRIDSLGWACYSNHSNRGSQPVRVHSFIDCCSLSTESNAA